MEPTWYKVLTFAVLITPLTLLSLVVLSELVTTVRTLVWLLGWLWTWGLWLVARMFWFVYAVWLPISLLGLGLFAFMG